MTVKDRPTKPTPPPPGPSPFAVVAFAEQMLATVRKRRTEQLTAGAISQAKHDADVAAAQELLMLAQNLIIFDEGAPLN